MKAPLLRRLAGALLLLAACAPAALAQTNLTEGTVVRVRLLETLDSGGTLNTGDQVTMEVADNVEVNGVTVIRAGARATGTVTEVSKAKWGGRKGKLDFTIDYVQTVDGQNVRVRSQANGARGRGSVGLMAAGAVLLSPVALAMRGKNAVIERGTEFSVYTDQDRAVQAQ